MCLGNNNQLNGKCKFLSLTTGKLLDKGQWTEIPLATDVITRVETMAQSDNLVFGDRHDGDTDLHDAESDIAGVHDDDDETPEEVMTNKNNNN